MGDTNMEINVSIHFLHDLQWNLNDSRQTIKVHFSYSIDYIEYWDKKKPTTINYYLKNMVYEAMSWITCTWWHINKMK